TGAATSASSIASASSSPAAGTSRRPRAADPSRRPRAPTPPLRNGPGDGATRRPDVEVHAPDLRNFPRKAAAMAHLGLRNTDFGVRLTPRMGLATDHAYAPAAAAPTSPQPADHQPGTVLLAELARSEERSALAIRAANDGIWDWYLVSETLYLVPRWHAIIGRTYPELFKGTAF